MTSVHSKWKPYKFLISASLTKSVSVAGLLVLNPLSVCAMDVTSNASGNSYSSGINLGEIGSSPNFAAVAETTSTSPSRQGIGPQEPFTMGRNRRDQQGTEAAPSISGSGIASADITTHGRSSRFANTRDTGALETQVTGGTIGGASGPKNTIPTCIDHLISFLVFEAVGAVTRSNDGGLAQTAAEPTPTTENNTPYSDGGLVLLRSSAAPRTRPHSYIEDRCDRDMLLSVGYLGHE